MERRIFTKRRNPVRCTTQFNEEATLNSNQAQENSCTTNNLESISYGSPNVYENSHRLRNQSSDQQTDLHDIPLTPDEQIASTDEPNNAAENPDSSEEVEWEIVCIPYSKNVNRKKHQMGSGLPKKRPKAGECSGLGHSNAVDSTHYESETNISTQIEGLTENEMTTNPEEDYVMTHIYSTLQPQKPSSQQKVASRSSSTVLTGNPDDTSAHTTMSSPVDTSAHTTMSRPSFDHGQAEMDQHSETSPVEQRNRSLILRKCGHSYPFIDTPSSSKAARMKANGIKTRSAARKCKSAGSVVKCGRYFRPIPKFSVQGFALEIIKSQHPYLVVTSDAALKLEMFLADMVHRIGDEAKNLVTLSTKKQLDSRVLKYAVKLTLEQIKNESDVAAGKKELWLF